MRTALAPPTSGRISGWHCRRFKIGITNNPLGRFSNGYARDYDQMIVVYQSASLDSVSQVECDLIEHNGDITRNRITGGGGDYGEPPYYLYLVVRYKRRRET